MTLKEENVRFCFISKFYMREEEVEVVLLVPAEGVEGL
jgi:hypothetical protein